MATVDMVKLVFFSGDTSVPRWQIAIPILGIIVLGYTLFRNVWPLPTEVAGWGRAWRSPGSFSGSPSPLVQPAEARRAGELLTRAEAFRVTDYRARDHRAMWRNRSR
jgi:hypothetical protein